MEEEAVNAKILLSASACNDKDRHKRRAVPANFLRLEITMCMCFNQNTCGGSHGQCYYGSFKCSDVSGQPAVMQWWRWLSRRCVL